MANNIGNEIIRTPHQASHTYNLSGASPPRPKNLFYMTMVRAGAATTQSRWQSVIGFLVKSVDRPIVSPEVQELNQYNKRRQVNVGYKLREQKITFYDTADSLALQMWNEYSQQFFGDFAHYQQPGDWGWDVMANTFKDSGKGFGFNPAALGSSDDNSQFFFDKISVFQVYGTKYIQYDLINPKITSFDPEPLSYEDSSMSTIMISVAYEALLWANNAQPQPMMSNATLAAAFETNNLNGNVVDYPNAAPSPSNAQGTLPGTIAVPNYAPFGYPAQQPVMEPYPTSQAGGALASYGSYSFGPSSGTNLNGTDLSVLASQNPQIASALNIANAIAEAVPLTLSSPYQQQQGIGEAGDIAHDLVRHTGRVNDDIEHGQHIAAGLYGAARAQHRGMNELISNVNGLLLDPTVIATLNATRNSTTQIGFNESVDPHRLDRTALQGAYSRVLPLVTALWNGADPLIAGSMATNPGASVCAATLNIPACYAGMPTNHVPEAEADYVGLDPLGGANAGAHE